MRHRGQASLLWADIKAHECVPARLLDWLTSLRGNILEKFAEHPDPATILQLTRLLREGATRRMGARERNSDNW
jgi:hypothetical protein